MSCLKLPIKSTGKGIVWRRILASLLIAAECFSIAAAGMPVVYASDTAPQSYEQAREPVPVSALDTARLSADAARQYADEAERAAAEAEQAAAEAEQAAFASDSPDPQKAAEAARRAEEAALLAAQAAERAEEEAIHAFNAAAQAFDEAEHAWEWADQVLWAADDAVSTADAIDAEAADLATRADELLEAVQASATPAAELDALSESAAESPEPVPILDAAVLDALEQARFEAIQAAETARRAFEEANRLSDEAASAFEQARQIDADADLADETAEIAHEQAQRAVNASRLAAVAGKRAAAAAAQTQLQTQSGGEEELGETAIDGDKDQSADELKNELEVQAEDELQIWDESQTEAEPQAEEDPRTEEEPKTEDETQAEDEPKTEDETQAEDEPKTEDETQAEDEPKTEEEPNTEDEPKTEEESKAEDEPETENSPVAVAVPEGIEVAVESRFDDYANSFDPANFASADAGQEPFLLLGDAMTFDAPMAAANERERLEQYRVLAAYDITLKRDGEEYQPEDGAVELVITDPAIEQTAESKLQLWHIHDDNSIEQIVDFTVEGDSVRLMADSFSVYLIVEYTLTQIIRASDGNDYLVAVTCDNTSGIPEDVELEITELSAGTEEYEGYVQRAAEALGSDAGKYDFAYAFDISLIDPATGEHCQPAKPVAVSVSLLKEDVQEGDEIDVVHFPASHADRSFITEDEAAGAERLDASLNGEAVAFESTGFSVYVIMKHVLVETLTASDGNTYQITVTYDDTAHLPEDVALHAEEITQESADFALYLDQICEHLDRTYWDYEYARFFDISLVSAEDPSVHYQPEAEVEVSIRLIDTPEKTVDTLQVLHIGDETIETMDATAEGNALIFKTDSFSIYPIIDGVNGPNARIAYAFWYYNIERGEYERIVTQYFRYKDVHPEEEGVSAARIYEPAIPGTTPEGGVDIFDGWHLGDYDGTEVIMHPQTTTVAILNSELENLRSTDFIEGTIYHIVAKLKDAYYITYADTNPLNVLKTQLVIKAPEGETTYFSVDPHLLPTKNGEDLIGWRLETEAASPTATLYERGSSYPVSENITLVPVIENGHWLVFDDNDLVDDGTGKMVSGGASYTAPAFYMNSSKEKEPTVRPADPTWDGYVFEGWFEDPACTIPFTFGELLEQDMTVHAKWTAGPSAYTVLIWKQKSTDAPDAADKDKTYDFDRSFRLGMDANGELNGTVHTGDLIWLDPQYSNIYGAGGTSSDDTKQYFTFNDNKTPDYIIVKASGDSVFNVYYDRVTMTINFYTWQNSSGYVYTPTTAETGTLYGYVDGLGYVRINKAAGSNGIHSYSYSPTYNATTGDTGTQYGIIDGEYQELTAAPVYGFTRNRYDETDSTAAGTTQYALISDHYVELARNTRIHYYPTSGTSYTAADSDGDDNPAKYGFVNGNETRVYASWTGSAIAADWYTSATIHLIGTRYNGNVFTKSTAAASTAEYTGTIYYAGNGGFSTNGSGTPYGRSGDTYFPLQSETEIYWTYGGAEYTGQRYIRNGTRIDYTGQRYQRTGGSSPSNYTYAATDAQTTGLYGRDERGGYIGLTISQQPTGYTYSYNGTPYTGTRYVAGNVTPVNYSGQLYVKNGTGSFSQTGTDGDNRYGKDANGAYRLLQHKVSYPDVWEYTDTNGVTHTYPSSAQRFTRSTGNQSSWQIYKTFNGLYGSSLSTYGYSWPTNYNWYDNGHGRGGNQNATNQNGQGTTSGGRMTLKTTFEPLEGSLTASYYGGTPTTNGSHIRFYLQNLDGSYPNDPDSDIRTGNNSGNFHINDKYAGFHAVQYRTNQGTWQNVTPKGADGYYGNAISYSNYFDVRFARNDYTFNYTTNNASSQIISKTVKYEAPLAGYDSQSPGQKPGYYFAGWYADDAFTNRVFFDQASYDAYTGEKTLMSKMPDHNEMIYGYWRLERTRVVIVPGASDVNMGSQALSFRLDYGERIGGGLLESATRQGYILDGWYTDENFTNRFLFSTPVSSSVTGVHTDYQTATKWTSSRVSYHDDDESHANVRNILVLYAKWIVDTNVKGIKVIYDAGEAARHDSMGSLITEIPVDSRLYQPDSLAVVGAPPDNYNELFIFDYWEAVDADGNVVTMMDNEGNPITQLQTGTVFSVNLQNNEYFAQTVNSETGEPILSTIKLRAKYHLSDQSKSYTHITYDGNEFIRPDYDNGTVTVHGKTKDGQDEERVTLDTKINDTVVLPGENDFYLPGYRLVGWSFFQGTYEEQEQQLTAYNNSHPGDPLTSFVASQKVAADQLAQGTVNTEANRLYGMWQIRNYTVTVRQVVEDGVPDTSFDYWIRSGAERSIPANYITQNLNGNAQQSYTTLTANNAQRLEYYELAGHVFQIRTPPIAANKDYAVRVTAFVDLDDGSRETITPQTVGEFSSYQIYGDVTITYTYSRKVNVKLIKQDLRNNTDLRGSIFRLTPVAWDLGTNQWSIVGDAVEFNMTNSATASQTLLEGDYRVDEIQVPDNYAPLGVALLLTVRKTDDFGLTLMNGSAVDERIAKLSSTAGDQGNDKKHTLTLYDRPLRTITVTKQVVDHDVIRDDTYPFMAHIALEGADLASFDTGTSGDWDDFTNSAGIIEFALKKDESKEIRIPWGSVITIEETENPRYKAETISANNVADLETDTGRIYRCIVDNDDTITFKNTRDTLDITVKKTVPDDDKRGTFSFAATLSYGTAQLPGTYLSTDPISNWPIRIGNSTYDSTNYSGRYTFTLQNDEDLVLTIPVSAKLTIQETSATGMPDGVTFDSYSVTAATTLTVDAAAYTGTTAFDGSTKLYTLTDAPEHDLTVTFTNTVIAGSRKVILRKVSAADYSTISGRSFTVYQGSSTNVCTVKREDGTMERLENLPSLSSGVFWIGVLPYGNYTIAEDNGKWFTLTVGDDTVEGSRDGVVISEPLDNDPRA